MNVIQGKRGSGKTYELVERIKQSMASTKVLIVPTQNRKNEFLWRILPEHGIHPDSVNVKSFSEFFQNRLRSSLIGSNYAVFVDDFEYALNYIFGSTDYLTVTIPDDLFCIREMKYIPDPPIIHVSFDDFERVVSKLSGTIVVELIYEHTVPIFRNKYKDLNLNVTWAGETNCIISSLRQEGCEDIIVVKVR